MESSGVRELGRGAISRRGAIGAVRGGEGERLRMEDGGQRESAISTIGAISTIRREEGEVQTRCALV